MKLIERFKTSSKWQAVLIGIVWSLAQPWLIKWGVNEEQFLGVLAALGLGVGAQAAVDLGKEATK